MRLFFIVVGHVIGPIKEIYAPVGCFIVICAGTTNACGVIAVSEH